VDADLNLFSNQRLFALAEQSLTDTAEAS